MWRWQGVRVPLSSIPYLCSQVSARQTRFLSVSRQVRQTGQSQTDESAAPILEAPEAYVSTSTSPLFNLSLEEHLLRAKPPNVPVCFIYRNSPCVVIGRNQNHWKELNIDEMRQRQLALVRRRSGGGAVFHDMGNTNFSFHVPRMTFARRTHAELMARALNGPAVGLRTLVSPSQPCPPASGFRPGQGSPEGVYVNDRNDLVIRICVENARAKSKHWSERKISGSAFKILTHKAYHHGTTLLDADLTSLGSALRNTKSSEMVSKGVESVKSSVVNLSSAYPEVAAQGLLTHDAFTRAVVNEFWRTYSRTGRDDEDSEQAQIQEQFISVDETHPLSRQDKRKKLQDEISQWDWIFGQCPEFEVEFHTGNASSDAQAALKEAGLLSAQVWLRCKNGIIEEVAVRSIEVKDSEPPWRAAIGSLVGQRYDVFTDSPPLPNSVSENVSAEWSGLQAARQLADDNGHVGTSLARWFREAL